MKKLCAGLLAALLVGLCGCDSTGGLLGTGKEGFKIAEQYPTIAPMGNAPAEYSREALETLLQLKNAVQLGDGHLSLADRENMTVIKRDAAGREIWRKSYDYPNKEFAGSVLFPAKDGFYLVCEEGEHQLRNGKWQHTEPRLFRCGLDGNVLWAYNCKAGYNGALKYVWPTPDGKTIAIGTIETPETKTEGVNSYEAICLSLLDAHGSLIRDAVFGGSDYDWLNDAYYLPGKGVVGLAYTQSRDGDFAASPDGYGRQVLFLVDEELRLVWHIRVDEDDRTNVESCFRDDGIYILTSRNEGWDSETGEGDFKASYRKYDYEGNLMFQESQLTPKNYKFGGSCALGLVIQECGWRTSGEPSPSGWQTEKLLFRKEQEVVLELPFDAGDVQRVVDTDFGILIVSVKTVGRKETSPAVSFIPPVLQTVWSAYDTSGNLLWRTVSEQY